MFWEYKIVKVSQNENNEAFLNAFGSQGWELVAVSVQFTTHYYSFKRPLKTKAASGEG